MINKVHCTEGNPYKDKYKIFTLEECLACANSGQNTCNLTPAMVRAVHAMWQDSETRNPYSASSISQCPRKTILKHKINYGENPEKNFSALRGTVWHNLIETHTDSSTEIAEQRFFREFNGVEVSGSPDLIDIKNGILYDYKTVEKVPLYKYPYIHHKNQVNIYRWILDTNNIQIDTMYIVYISMKDVKKLEAIKIPFPQVEEMVKETIDKVEPALEDEDSWYYNLPNILPYDHIECSFCQLKLECYTIHEQQLVEK